MIKISGIYAILNLSNEKVYVGSTNNILRRKNTHFSFLNKKEHANPYLQASYNKYGQDKFVMLILESVEDINLLDVQEESWINKLQSNNPLYGYNLREVAGSNRGLKYSAEIRKKLSEQRKGKAPSEYTLKRAKEVNTGSKRSEESKRKMSEAKRGRVLSEEHRMKISVSNKGKKDRKRPV